MAETLVRLNARNSKRMKSVKRQSSVTVSLTTLTNMAVDHAFDQQHFMVLDNKYKYKSGNKRPGWLMNEKVK